MRGSEEDQLKIWDERETKKKRWGLVQKSGSREAQVGGGI